MRYRKSMHEKIKFPTLNSGLLHRTLGIWFQY